MDHNLDDELNLDSTMGVDFENAEDVVVSHADISLVSGSHTGIPMEFDHIEEQPMLMDTTNDEVIVPEFMADQFTLQGYSISDNETVGTSMDGASQQSILSKSDTLADLQFEQGLVTAVSKQDSVRMQSKIVAVKTTIPSRTILKKTESSILASAPRQVAIAPKPFTASNLLQQTKSSFTKQLPIAPKPVTLVANRPSPVVKKVSLANFMQGNVKGSTVLGQVGKQLIMVPTSGSQKIKLISAGGQNIQYIKTNNDQVQLTSGKSIVTSQGSKPVFAKVVVQGQTSMDPSDQPAMITKIVPGSSASQTRIVMQQKTIPLGNKVLASSPTKSPMKMSKSHDMVTTPKLVPINTQGPTTKKVVISSNPKSNVVLKTTAPPKTLQGLKGNVINIQGQHSQIHQIHVPGKGVQYIRLVSNPTSPAKSTAKKTQNSEQEPPPKTFLITDSKGNVIQMTAEKVNTGQPPSLVLTSAAAAKLASTSPKASSKIRQRLVRIAPVSSQPQQVMPVIRSTHSLLAPLMEEQPTLEDAADFFSEESPPEDHVDSKATLRALIDNVPEELPLDDGIQHGEVEIQFERQESGIEDDSTNSIEGLDSSNRSEEHPLIVIPSSFIKQHQHVDRVDGEIMNNNHMSDIELEGLTQYQRPQTPQALSDSDIPTELSTRPRKACNCTKSQCLKLYCDCFANGEFCNRCNCNNCHNNLENEELRQKAIRGCLERNPNAFRPKIGKSKNGGPEIIRRHNKGCNCKRSGCLKNYCECYEAKIACSSICKCVGCRNVEETLERGRRREPAPARETSESLYRPNTFPQLKAPCSFMTNEVIEAVCQCLLAAAMGGEGSEDMNREPSDPVEDVLEEFARCLQDIIGAAHQPPLSGISEGPA